MRDSPFILHKILFCKQNRVLNAPEKPVALLGDELNFHRKRHYRDLYCVAKAIRLLWRVLVFSEFNHLLELCV